MKKNILALFISVLLCYVVNAQCDCGTGYSWKQSKIRIGNGPDNLYKCGYIISVTVADTIQFLDGGYTCNVGGIGTCRVKTTATLKNSAGVVVRTFNPFNINASKLILATAGTYTLTINTTCGSKKCNPCVYTFVVSSPVSSTCACDPQNYWEKFTAYTESVPSILNCNGTVYSVKNQQIGIEGGYKCAGNCTVNFSAVLYNSVSGAVVENIPSFNFTWLHTFTAGGKYKLVITPNCNGVACQSCVLFFIIA